MPWLLADGVGTGGECYSHGHSWRGMWNHRIVLSDVSQSPVIITSHSSNLFFLSTSPFPLALNICLYCSHTILPNFLTLSLANAEVKQAGALLPPAWAKPNKDVSIGMWEHWTCSWLKWQRFPHHPRPILYTITLISWKETRSCWFQKVSMKKKKAKNSQIKAPHNFLFLCQAKQLFLL